MTAGASEFAWLASSSLPPVNGDAWNGRSVPSVPIRQSLHSSNGGMDLNRIQQMSYALQELSSDASIPVPNSPMSVPESIRETRERIINQLFQDQMQKTRERCDKIHAAQMVKDWEVQKALYMNELVGDRRLGVSFVGSKFDSMTDASLSSITTPQFQMADHLRLVKEMRNQPDKASMIYEFSRIANHLPSYAAAWKLVYALAQRKLDSPVGRATATMAHLSRQFQAHISNRVRSMPVNAIVNAPPTYTGMAHTIATFVSLTVGSHASHWASIYYSLRCGDFVSARQILDAHETSHVLAPILETFARQQGAEPCLWDQNSCPIATSISTHHQPSSDDFENHCVRLFSGPNSEESSSVIKTIEDYIYASLWNAFFHAKETEEELVLIGAKIKALGAKHFQGDSINAWSYVTPLLLTQQYYSAMLFMVENDGERGILQATHLSLFLPELQDLGEPLLHCLLSNLLIEFSSKFIPANPSDALAYLVLIPKDSLMRKKIVELIVNTRQFEELAGTLSPDGVRQGEKSVMNQHFPGTVVCDLLQEAAFVARSRGNMNDALELLLLAERYVILLSMLNEQLASILNQVPGKERDFWIKACRDFNSWHFSGRRTRAVEVLEASDSLLLVDTFHILLTLVDFFDRLRMHDFKKATSIIESLFLLPLSIDDLQAKVSSYSLMDPTVRKAFPSVLEGVIDALHQQFVRTRYTGKIEDVAFVEENRKELKRKASLITSFAGALSMPLDLRSRIANMEAQMI